MGRYARKREGSGEAAAAAGGGRRKRKTASELSTPPAQLKTQRLASTSPASSENSTCESVSSDSVLGSCCSSSGLTGKSPKLADLEENAVNVEHIATSAGHSVDFRDRREKTPSSEVQGELESTARPVRESNSRRRLSALPEKMPTEAELEEFFAAAEKNMQKQFVDKYNYDIVKDEPLEGRYEWVPVQLKP